MSILPLFAAIGETESGDMRQSTLLVGDSLVLRPLRLADRVLARAFGASLDRQLAAGRAPEAAMLLASRAQHIVSPRGRQAVAGDWDHLLRVTRRGQPRRMPAVPVRAGSIVAAEPAIRELVRRLSTPLPVRAQGVAMATVLLTDATGPLYSRDSSVTLAAALEAVITQLDPALPLMQPA
jgi:hypothetical protein